MTGSYSGAYNAILTLKDDGKWEVNSLNRLPEEFHAQISPEELIACEVVVKNNPTIQKLAAEVGMSSRTLESLQSIYQASA